MLFLCLCGSYAILHLFVYGFRKRKTPAQQESAISLLFCIAYNVLTIILALITCGLAFAGLYVLIFTK